MPWVVRRQEWVKTPRKGDADRPPQVLVANLHPFHLSSKSLSSSSPLGSWRASAWAHAGAIAVARSTSPPLFGKDGGDIDLEKPLDVRSRLWLAAQQRMEVAGVAVVVHDGLDPATSEEIETLKPFTKLCVLAVREQSDGSKRACVVREGGTHPLGWLTSTSADGVPFIYRYARPLYETACPVKVRKHFDATSKFVTQLPMGTRLHVTETRRAADGTVRVAVAVVGREDALGWMTAKRRDGTK